MAANKPAWVIDKERAKKGTSQETVWLFGLHAVRDALLNPKRQKVRLIVTRNAADKLSDAIAQSGIAPEMAEARRFPAPIDPRSVHQGAALEVVPLAWRTLEELCMGGGGGPPRVLMLDRVTDPHNVGSVLRSAEVLGACAVIAPRHHSAPETGALAKSASGALERQPYLRVRNLCDAVTALQKMGFIVIGLDREAEAPIESAVDDLCDRPVALVVGAEGSGLRTKTKATVDRMAHIPNVGGFGSLNVSNAAAIALYATQHRTCWQTFSHFDRP